MKLNPTEVLRDYRGNPIRMGDADMTLRDAVTTALNALDPQRLLTAEKLNKAFQISVKMHSAKDTVNLTVDDMAFIKERAALVYNALVFGRLSQMFEGGGDDQIEAE